MARGSKKRQHSRRICPGCQTAVAGGAIVKPRSVTCPGRGIRRRGGHATAGRAFKPEGDESEVEKRSTSDLAKDACIYVRGHRIDTNGLRFRIDSNGNVYVPDSEDEESGMEVAAELKAKSQGADGVELPPALAANRTAGEEMYPDVVARLANKVTGEDLRPEVVELMAKVLSRMEPLFHETFISMCKIFVPLWFKPHT